MSKKGSPKMKELLARVMQPDKVMSEETALDAVVSSALATVEAVNESLEPTKASESLHDIAPAIASPEADVARDFAYNITFDDITRRYMLHTIEYGDDGYSRYVSNTEFAKYLPEASHKLNQMMLDKLMYTMAPNYKPKKK